MPGRAEGKKYIRLALDADQMFQKAIAKAAVEQRELKFEAMDRAYIGFTTGMDADWVRITETDESLLSNRLRRILIRVENISALCETGRTIASLPDREAEQLRAYTGLFRKAAGRELAGSAEVS